LNKQSLFKRRGFNLVELLIAMVVLGLTIAVVVPTFKGLSNSSRLSSQASEMRTALNYARSEAIRLNTNILFCHSTNGAFCSPPSSAGWVGWIVIEAGANIGGETTVPLRVGLIDQTKLKVTSDAVLASASHAVRFNPQGLARFFGNNTPLSARIEVCIQQTGATENLYSVRFNSGGRSEVVKINNGGTCP
jgi:type IV fimbrial biogenesis protein FimT